MTVGLQLILGFEPKSIVRVCYHFCRQVGVCVRLVIFILLHATRMGHGSCRSFSTLLHDLFPAPIRQSSAKPYSFCRSGATLLPVPKSPREKKQKRKVKEKETGPGAPTPPSPCAGVCSSTSIPSSAVPACSGGRLAGEAGADAPSLWRGDGGGDLRLPGRKLLQQPRADCSILQ